MASNPSKVTRSRFELEEDGLIAYLEFETDDRGWITLIHTEVPLALRGRGIASTLARTALEYARDNNLKVDIICPIAADFIAKNPEFQHLSRLSPNPIGPTI
jgi:predicted GNAT family acetyltransferase